jgi:outer membrane protein assembly factor BamE (lipoprotein component of BamABCDE complex)
MNLKKNITFLAIGLILILNSACEHTKKNHNNYESNFVYKRTSHGIVNFKTQEDLLGKKREEILKILGPSVLKCHLDDSCEYYISSSSDHFYFKLPSVVEHVIYKICFDKTSLKSNKVEISNKTNENFNNYLFRQSLKNKENLSKKQIFKKIFESSEFKI